MNTTRQARIDAARFNMEKKRNAATAAFITASRELERAVNDAKAEYDAVVEAENYLHHIVKDQHDEMHKLRARLQQLEGPQPHIPPLTDVDKSKIMQGAKILRAQEEATSEGYNIEVKQAKA